MTKPKAPSQLKNVTPPSIPRNAIQRAEARDKGLITGFLSNRKRGAPPKLHNNPKVPRVTHTTTVTVAVTPIVTATIVPDKPTTSRGKYKNWKLEQYKSALDRAAEASLNGDDPQLAAGADIIIPGATLRKRVKEIKATLSERKGAEYYLYLRDFERGSNRDSTRCLTSELDRSYIQQLIVLRDMHNNGMTRSEVIGLIQKLATCSFAKAEQHWYYCRRKKLFPELKNHGAVRSAQATTTKRSGVTTEKLLRWHGTVDEALIELDRLNGWHEDWDKIKTSKKIDSFWGNMDETNMLAADGELNQQDAVHYNIDALRFLTIRLLTLLIILSGATKVIASKAVKKQQINKSDNKGTSLASGADGPRFFLVKGEKFDRATFTGDFAAKHGAPLGSKVIATPNAYMTDNVWNEMLPGVVDGHDLGRIWITLAA